MIASPQTETREYRFKGASIEKAMAYLAKANNRLAKAGIEDRFEAVNVETGTVLVREGQYPFQTTTEVDYMEFDLNAPSIGHEKRITV